MHLRPTVVRVNINNLDVQPLCLADVRASNESWHSVTLPSREALGMFSRVLCQLNELQALRCAALPDESALDLSQLPNPNLNILRMDLRLISLDHLESAFGRVRFPALQEVLLSAPTTCDFLRFLKFVRSTSVDTVNLNVDDETCAADYHVIFTAWVSNPVYRNLSVIDISAMQVCVIDVSVLQPLFQLSRFTSLKLEAQDATRAVSCHDAHTFSRPG